MPAALVSESDLISLMQRDVTARRSGAVAAPVTVFDTNGQALSLAAEDAAYRECLEQGDIVHADGQFLIWISRIGRGRPIPERTATTDLFLHASEAAARDGIRFFLLGSSKEINEACTAELRQRYPGLQIVGNRDGYFGADDEDDVVRAINDSGADVVWIGLGKPKEQLFAQRVKSRLDCAWIVTCGGCFHYVVGDYPRAPAWMQKTGLEWLHRMATGPRYLIGRYLYTIPHAIGLVIWHDVLRPLFKSRRAS